MAAGYVDDEEIGTKSDSEFRKAFKMYRNTPPDRCPDLIDFDKIDNFPNIVKKRPIASDDDDLKSKFDKLFLRWPPSDEWSSYEVVGKPGFTFLKNPFTNQGHFYWPKRCLADYARRPHVTNVDSQLEREKKDFKDATIFDDEKLLKKLRWATMGYHHDWNTKVYQNEKRSEIPDDLRSLGSTVAEALFGRQTQFRVEAVIVNFYRMNSTLAGHVDHSEWNLDSPLFSFSFGQAAIFLLGGRSLDDKPMAVKIKSGDVVVMSDECRLAYHGVPRIFSDANFVDNIVDSEDDVVKYLSKNRINMNVRQVN